MATKEFQQYLSRRILTEHGWSFFCRLCGEYKPEADFYKSKKNLWGLDSKCKIHYTNTKDTEDMSDMDYMKLSPVKESDFINVQVMLERMGYKFGEGEESVHQQLMNKMKNKFGD